MSYNKVELNPKQAHLSWRCSLTMQLLSCKDNRSLSLPLLYYAHKTTDDLFIYKDAQCQLEVLAVD